MRRYGLAPGETVAGKYRVDRVLGEGGMGLVVAAHHEVLDCVVALKLLSIDSAKDPVLVSRFLREGRSAAGLKSEHVARVLDVGTLDGGAPFLVMEYLEGADLARLLGQRGALPVDLACDYVVQACKGVGEAHAAGIVHRDLKPENLFLANGVGGAARVKVVDFGLSKSIAPTGAALTRTGVVLGSPAYMAPEQLRGTRGVGPRTDVWALGVVLFELLTGRCPFDADSLPDLCLLIVDTQPPPVRDLRGEVPEALARIVARCLEKDPAKRFFDATELAEALAPFLPRDERASDRGPAWSRPKLVDSLVVTLDAPATPPPARRLRRAMALTAAGAVAVLALAGGWGLTCRASAHPVVLAAVGAAGRAASFAQVTALPDPASPATLAPATAPSVPAGATPAMSRVPASQRTAAASKLATGNGNASSGNTGALGATSGGPGKGRGDDDIPAFR